MKDTQVSQSYPHISTQRQIRMETVRHSIYVRTAIERHPSVQSA